MRWSVPQIPFVYLETMLNIACSQTLYFLFKVCRAWVIKYKPQGIFWPPAQGGSGGKKKTDDACSVPKWWSGVEAEYFDFSILYSNCQYSIFKHQYSIFKPQYLIFKPQYSIFRLPYLCYFHYLNNYDLSLYSLFFYKSHVLQPHCIPLQ